MDRKHPKTGVFDVWPLWICEHGGEQADVFLRDLRERLIAALDIAEAQLRAAVFKRKLHERGVLMLVTGGVEILEGADGKGLSLPEDLL